VYSGPVRTPGRPTFEDLLRMATRAGGLGRRPGAPPTIPPIVTGEKIVSAFGCLRRLVMLVVFLAILAAIAFFSLFGVGGLLYGASPAPSPELVGHLSDILTSPLTG
jgi:hypothetical protein